MARTAAGIQKDIDIWKETIRRAMIEISELPPADQEAMRSGIKSLIEERTLDPNDPAAKALGAKGGKARAASLSAEKRSEIAKKAAAKRWEKP